MRYVVVMWAISTLQIIASLCQQLQNKKIVLLSFQIAVLRDTKTIRNRI